MKVSDFIITMQGNERVVIAFHGQASNRFAGIVKDLSVSQLTEFNNGTVIFYKYSRRIHEIIVNKEI